MSNHSNVVFLGTLINYNNYDKYNLNIKYMRTQTRNLQPDATEQCAAILFNATIHMVAL